MEKYIKNAFNKHEKHKIKKTKVLAFLLVFAMLLTYINAPFSNKGVLAATEETTSNPGGGGAATIN